MDDMTKAFSFPYQREVVYWKYYFLNFICFIDYNIYMVMNMFDQFMLKKSKKHYMKLN